MLHLRLQQYCPEILSCITESWFTRDILLGSMMINENFSFSDHMPSQFKNHKIEVVKQVPVVPV